eukprot:2647858-Rhodomonas_salina.8
MAMSTVLQGHSPVSVRETLQSLEAAHLTPITVWCPTCQCFSLNMTQCMRKGVPQNTRDDVVRAMSAHVMHMDSESQIYTWCLQHALVQ